MARLRPFSLPFLFGFFIGLPIFFSVQGGISLAPEFSQAVATNSNVLPLSTFLMFGATLFFGLALIAGYARMQLIREDTIVILYFVIVTFDFIMGVFDGSIRTEFVPIVRYLSYYFQSVMPVAAYALARLIVFDGKVKLQPEEYAERTQQFVAGFVIAILLSLTGYIVQTILTGPAISNFTILSDHIGPFYNYTVKRFYSVYLYSAGIFLLAVYLFGYVRLRTRILTLIGGGGCYLIIPLLWSRTVMVAGAIGGLSLLAFTFNWKRIRYAKRTGMMFGTGAAVIVLGLFVLGLGGKSIDRIVDTIERLGAVADQLNSADSARFARMSVAVQDGLLTPLGDEFQPYIGGHSLIAENGYLDIAVKGGPIALCLALLVFIMASGASLELSRDSYRNPALRKYRWLEIGIFLNIFVFTVWINIWVNVATEPYTAPFFWSLFSLVLAPISVARSERARLAAAAARA